MYTKNLVYYHKLFIINIHGSIFLNYEKLEPVQVRAPDRNGVVQNTSKLPFTTLKHICEDKRAFLPIY